MGKATLLSSKFFSAVWSNNNTHVSNTKILVFTFPEVAGFPLALAEGAGLDEDVFWSRLGAGGVAMPSS